jgi:tetratricopeptide (TPR) repeat protein
MQSARDCIIEAGALLDSGQREQARAALLRAEAIAGDDAGIYRALAIGYCMADMQAEATTAEMAALAYEQRSAAMLYNIGTALLMTQRSVQAEKWFRAALRIDPAMVIAHQNLATILEANGQSEQAQTHRDQAYSHQNLFIEPAANARISVLVLCAPATGNTPFDYLLPSTSTTRIKWIMDYASEAQIADLPEYDVVFNAIGDHDVSARSQAIVHRFLSVCSKPVLNLPNVIARTTREQMPRLLQGIDGLLVPQVKRMSATDNRDIGISFPCLLRPLGSHGGQGLRLLENVEQYDSVASKNADHYLTAFHDFRSSDGYYRKYRVIFIDRKPYPYHLAIAPQWLVHYVNADMLAHAWKRQEEERFLDAPETVLGPRAMQALSEIAQRIDLDFCGIDFSLLPDGRILLFEANATMLVHLEEFHPELQFKNRHVQGILDAFNHMLVERLAG